LFLSASSDRASVKEMKLDSTPIPDLAEHSNIDRPVLFVNSKISFSDTYLSGIYSY
jgi:hypothetical protein